MDKATILAALRRLWEYEATDQDISHEIYHDDAVLEFPQSQERFEGKANFIITMWHFMHRSSSWLSLLLVLLQFNRIDLITRER